ncbi:GNAT family N-acetyltransferase [Dolosigranulum pigrum]|uniref:GNAT family N-acetyltransferase n=1 Tax=Dolosigranulum pigrum TaxID=29394 RepID=UPI00370D148D
MIREATAADLPRIIELNKIIMNDMEHSMLDNNDWATLKEALVEVGRHPEMKMNFRHILVKVIDDEVVGFVCGYMGGFQENHEVYHELEQKYGIDNLDQFDERETFNEWYLDSIVVSPDFQRRGIGSELIEAAMDRARNHGHARIGLNCDKANEKARKAYEKLGFKPIAEVTLEGHLYDHMQRSL